MLINQRLLLLGEELGSLLQQHSAKIATAESCTGGAIAAALTAVAGSSAWFDGGFVTYSNTLKQTLLGVPEALILEHGVVSEPVVASMLDGACRAAGARFGIAVSGVAGPSGGSKVKPVGTVSLAWGARDGIATQTFHFSGDRDAIREQSVVAGLQGLIAYLKTTV